MADIIDRAQERQEQMLAMQIANARRPLSAPSAFNCEDCKIAIAEARRIAIPGVGCCVSCQQVREQIQKHYRGAL